VAKGAAAENHGFQGHMSKSLQSTLRPGVEDAGTQFIPFNRFCPIGTEFAYVQQAIDQLHVSGDGPFTRKCHRILEELLGVPKVLLTTSCTHALEMAALLLEIQPGDEVIVPSFTFVSTVNAFVLRGARPVFADIRPDTLNLNEALLEQLISPKTKTIIPVHYAGVSCQMEAITGISERHGLTVIEDNAHGLIGRYRGRPLGTFGAMSTLSFHETKNFACGEGGALVINDPRYIDRAEIIREKGTNRSRFFRGQIDKYTWVDVGSSYLPSDILAAILYAQLEARDEVQAARSRIWEYYDVHLKPWASGQGVGLPIVPEGCEHPFHMYYLLMPTLESRQALIAHLKTRNILSVFHYLPLHLSEMGRRFGGRPGDCPVTESVSDRLVRLPFYNSLAEPEQARIIEALRSFQP
jgi:dTDP-4-amino-4,6-dideoxygalactose transaminase